MSVRPNAFACLKELRSEIDERLSHIEDYRVLRALDKAILEVRITLTTDAGAPVSAAPEKAASSPVAVVQQNLKTGISENFSYLTAQGA